MIQTTSVQRIKIGDNRQRREFDAEALQALRQSIVKLGLMHAIVLRRFADDTLQLVAGERRLKAITEAHFLGEEFRFNGVPVPKGEIPYVTIEALDELAAEEAELEENTVRADLTWQEKGAAIARLHALRSKQAAAAGQPYSRSQTVLEVAGAPSVGASTEAHRQLAVAEAIARAPDTPAAKLAAKAPNVNEAFKILQRAENQQRYAEVAKQEAAVPTESKHRLIIGSCLVELAKPEWEGYFDIILSDPPYGMNADQFGDSGSADRTQGAHQYDDSYESWQSLMQAFIPLTEKVAKPQSHMYLFCDFDRFHELKQLSETAGWTVFRTPLVMQKAGQGGRVPLPNHGPRRQYELVLYAYRGQRQVKAILPDVFLSPLIQERIGHPAEKAVDGLRNLLQRSAFPGDRVLDAFCGSGPIFPAGEAESVRVVGIEMSDSFAGMAASRLRDLK